MLLIFNFLSQNKDWRDQVERSFNGISQLLEQFDECWREFRVMKPARKFPRSRGLGSRTFSDADIPAFRSKLQPCLSSSSSMGDLAEFQQEEKLRPSPGHVVVHDTMVRKLLEARSDLLISVEQAYGTSLMWHVKGNYFLLRAIEQEIFEPFHYDIQASYRATVSFFLNYFFFF